MTAEDDAQRAVLARSGRGRGGSSRGVSSQRGRGGSVGRSQFEDRGAVGGQNHQPSMFRSQDQRDAGYSAPQAAASASAWASKVHPSWQAAKIRNQKEMGAVKPQGTKIVFD